MVELRRHGEGIVEIHLEDEASRNAIDTAFVDELDRISRRLQDDAEARVAIFTGMEGIFSSGGSAQLIGELHTFYEQGVEHDYLRKMKAMLDIPIPLIAAMEGGAVGGGLTLGLYADIVIAAEESRYGFSFMNMGFTPGMGTTALALEAFGPSKGFELMCTGELKTGRELRGSPGFSYVLPRAQVWPRALELAEAIAEKPRTALELCKRYLSLKRRQRLEETSLVEAMMHKISFGQPHIQELIREGFTG